LEVGSAIYEELNVCNLHPASGFFRERFFFYNLVRFLLEMVMNYIGAMLPIWLSPTTLIVLHHINDLAFIADMSGFYGYFKVETVVLWPVMLLVPHQLIYLFGNFHKRRGIQSVAARFGPPATLQRDMKARVPPANYVRFALFVSICRKE